MNLEGMKEKLVPFLESEGLKLYDLSFKKRDQILQIVLDEVMDLDTLEVVSGKISDFMDGIDQDMDEYLLDVCTAGAEKQIRSREELAASVGSYVHVKTADFESDGELVSFENDTVVLAYMDKTRKKNISIPYTEVKKIRHAIKF